MAANSGVNISNLLTFARIILTPLFVISFVYDEYLLSIVIFILAGLTDALDGFFAKRFGKVTQLGAVMDPVADKILLTTAFLTLTFKGWIPVYLCVVVILRDVLIVAGFMLVKKRIKVRPSPSVWGKVSTLLQVATVVISLFSFGVLNAVFIAVIFLTLIFTLLSGADYLIKGIKIYTRA